MIAPTSVDTNLSQLLEEVSSGKIQLPEFQRSWTWDDNRIQALLPVFHKVIRWGLLCAFNMEIRI